MGDHHSAANSHKSDGNSHRSAADIDKEGYVLAKFAEVGTKDDLKKVHDCLAQERKNMTAEDYNKLLKSMESHNQSDVKENPNLPTLEFYDSTGGHVPDSVQPEYYPSMQQGQSNMGLIAPPSRAAAGPGPGAETPTPHDTPPPSPTR